MSALSTESRRQSQLWPEVRHDAVRLIPGAVSVWLLMCGVGYLVAHPLTDAGFTQWEAGLDRWFVHHRDHFWNAVTNAASLAGDTPAAIGLSVLAFLVLRLSLHRWREPVLLAVSMVGEVCIFSATTIVVDRARPTVPHLDGAPPTSSFPSGHTAASTTLYAVLIAVIFFHTTRTRWRVLAVAAATLIIAGIGLSRLYRGMLYPSDILGGVLLGLGWATVTVFVLLASSADSRRSRGPGGHRG